MDVIRRRFLTPLLSVVICVGGCGAGLSPQVSANSDASGNSTQASLSSQIFEQIPVVHIVDSPACPALPQPESALPIVRVAAGDVEDLMRQLRKAHPGTTIEVEDGAYVLRKKQSLRFKVPGVTLRGASGNRDAVRIEGGASSVVISAEHITIADITIAGPRFHAIHVRGERGASHANIYNVRLLDAGQQFIKVSTGNNEDGPYGDRGLVACSVIEYTTYAKGNGRTPASYTNGVDILAGKGWVVRDNVFRRIRSQKGPAGPAILVWKNAQDTVIKRNRIVDSWRGIALGLMPPGERSRGGPDARYDHQNGLVENNVILALREPADAAIENNFARDSRIYHNTIFYREGLRHPVTWSIEYRFPATERIEIRNNLSNLPIRMRRPFPREQAVTGGNITTANMDWFVDVLGEDVHLMPDAIPIDRGVALPGSRADFDGTRRPRGRGPDIGADEYDASPDGVASVRKDR